MRTAAAAGRRLPGASAYSLAQPASAPTTPRRTYRLSGRRWIYNKLELVLRQGGGGGAVAAVAQAAAGNVQFAAAHQARLASRLRAEPLWDQGACRLLIGPVRSPPPAQPAAANQSGAGLVRTWRIQARPVPSCTVRPALQESAVAFLLQLDSGAKVQAHVYLCHAGAEPCSPGAAAAPASEEDGSGSEHFSWSARKLAVLVWCKTAAAAALLVRRRL